MKAVALLLVLATGAAAAACATACHPKPGQVDAGVVAVEAGCELVSALSGDGTVKSVCATVDEVAKLVGVIAAAQADGGLLGASGRCHVLAARGAQVCATDAQLSAGIDSIVAARLARGQK